MAFSKRKAVMTALAAAATVFVMVIQVGASAGIHWPCWPQSFPAFIPMTGVIPRGVAVDKVGNVYVSVGEVRSGISSTSRFGSSRRRASNRSSPRWARGR